jgi:hypothetical protein
MARRSLEGVNGWLLAYLVGSIPLLAIYSMGLSGWFFEYPPGLMAGIFIVLAVPLVLVLLKSPVAPRWNIAVLWISAALITVRAISVFFMPEPGEQMNTADLVGVVLILSAIVGTSIAWALIWTTYFRTSVRVRNTFGHAP